MISSILLAFALGFVSAQSDAAVSLESSDDKFNNKYLSNIHFGAAINGVLVSNQSVPYKFNTTDNTVYSEMTIAGGMVIPMTLGELSNDLVASPAASTAGEVKDNYLTINGSDSVFYACENMPWDPYHYTGSGTYGVAVFASDVPADCTSVKIKVDVNGGASNSSSNATTTPAQSSVPPAATGANSTVTDKSTKYTTIDCSTPTTMTYGSQTFTVTASTKITVEDCSCTAAPTKPSVAASSNSTGSIAVANGADSIKVGGAAAFGIAVAGAALFL